MSTNRTRPDAGWQDGQRPVGPSGRPTCRWCGAECPKDRRTFCRPACVHEFKMRSQPSYARRQVEKRDAGRCAACDMDCMRLVRLLGRLRERLWAFQAADPRIWDHHFGRARRIVGKLQARGFSVDLVVARGGSVAMAWRHAWEMDHTVPVVEGGGEVGLEGLRTLCRPCHRAATAELRVRLQQRRAVMSGRSNQTLLELERARVS